MASDRGAAVVGGDGGGRVRVSSSRARRWVVRLRRRVRRTLAAGRRAFSGPVGGAALAVVPFAAVVCMAAARDLPADARGGVLGAGTNGAGANGAGAFHPVANGSSTPFSETAGSRSLRTFAEIRHRKLGAYASTFRIDRGLAELIYETALREGLDPELGFRLVRVESSFRRGAVGPAGSIGLAQVRPATARWLQPGISRAELFEPETNLRLGFRYLGLLLREYGGEARLALLAYNRGPGTVAALLALGEDPANGYARRVLQGSR